MIQLLKTGDSFLFGNIWQKEKLEQLQITSVSIPFIGVEQNFLILHKKRETFYKILNEQSFKKAMGVCLKGKADVGILGYWYATNYGSVITYYALYKIIENLGYTAMLIDRPDKEKDAEPLTVFSREFLNNIAI